LQIIVISELGILGIGAPFPTTNSLAPYLT